MPVKFKLVKPVDDYDDVTLQYGTHFKIVGILEIVFGVLLATLEILSLIIDPSEYHIYLVEPGLWCGILFCATGWMALCSWRDVTKCNVIAGLILSLVCIMNCICWVSWYEGTTIRYLIAVQDQAYLLAFHIIIFLCSVGQFLACGVHVYYGIQSLRQMT